MAGKKIPLAERFWAKVDKDGPEPDGGDPLVTASGRCWQWVGARTTQGYGTIYNEGRQLLAHRVSVELAGGEPGEQTDHLCRNRLCVNPDHLESVTIQENTARGMGKAARAIREGRCSSGHALEGENLRIDPVRGGRVCKICMNRYYLMRRAVARDSRLTPLEEVARKGELIND